MIVYSIHAHTSTNSHTYMHLKKLTGKNSPIDVKQGNGYIEVLPLVLNKQTYLKFLFT